MTSSLFFKDAVSLMVKYFVWGRYACCPFALLLSPLLEIPFSLSRCVFSLRGHLLLLWGRIPICFLLTCVGSNHTLHLHQVHFLMVLTMKHHSEAFWFSLSAKIWIIIYKCGAVALHLFLKPSLLRSCLSKKQYALWKGPLVSFGFVAESLDFFSKTRIIPSRLQLKGKRIFY